MAGVEVVGSQKIEFEVGKGRGEGKREEKDKVEHVGFDPFSKKSIIWPNAEEQALQHSLSIHFKRLFFLRRTVTAVVFAALLSLVTLVKQKPPTLLPKWRCVHL